MTRALQPVYDGDPITGRADLMAWLDSCLDGLGVPRADICAHSYGGWIALRYALHAPQRVARLVLLDPTQCLSGQRLTYRLHKARSNVKILLAPRAGIEPATYRLGGGCSIR